MSGTETVALVRDVAFITLFVVLVFITLLLARTGLAVMRSVRRTLGSFRDMTATVSKEFRPAAGAGGLAVGVGTARSIFRRLSGRGRE